ncbi:MAG: protein-glutamate O-methyltransferase CheR [Chlorobi bacterium]|nr:protein-glutamate O-methyltransferase CheR [Chlorobiota bacterium]
MTEKVENIAEIRIFLRELKKHSSYDFCDYSDSSIMRRVSKILNDNKIDMDQLITRIRTDSEFVENVVQDITVNTTEFFRDPWMWKELYKNYLPSLKNKKIINIWHAGCSSGQEVYSNLILLNELGLLDKSRVVATDINNEMLKIARTGVYNAKYNKTFDDNIRDVLECGEMSADVSVEKYFDISEDDGTIRIKSFLRKIPVFKYHDLVNGDIDSIKFDIIFCRNVLIYFNTSLQTRILQKFHKKLVNRGMLILGNHEGVNGFYRAKFSKDGPVYIKNSAYTFQF